jgi:3-phenylpropionate/cinnamic acid dioxygenase small subunit
MSIEDEHAIAKLIITYARLNDAARWDDVAALYVPDGRMSRPVAPDDFIEGADAILAAFQSRPPRTTRHVCVNTTVDVDSDSASAESNTLLFTGKDTMPLVGGYQDKLVRTEAGWRFVERRGSLDFKTV